MELPEFQNFLSVKTRKEFRMWLSKHPDTENECHIIVKKGKPSKPDVFYYIDAVEEALCFGWIDSTFYSIDGIGHVQRFSKRRENSHWSELNIERCRRLERLGLMTDAGRAVLPTDELKIDDDILAALKKDKTVWRNFTNFPVLYQRIRISNIQRERNNPPVFERTLKKLIDTAKQNEIYGEWTDYGRLYP